MISVVVPTYNMSRFLTPLFESVVNSALAPSVGEILFVNDGSTDDTREVIGRLIERQRGSSLPVRLVEPEINIGRFEARHLGAESAGGDIVFFIDSRITLPAATTEALVDLTKIYPALVAHTDIDETKNIYCLYWRRSHARFYRAEEVGLEPVTINAANFGEVPFGSTCFLCPRAAYLAASKPFKGRPMWSDDTLLFAELLKTTPFVLHPRFRFDWEPRDQLGPFLKRLFDRGPGLAQYHFFRRRGPLFYATLGATLYLAACLGLAFFEPFWSVLLLGFALGITALSTALFVKSLGEFVRLAPLHVAVVAAYGFGGLYGIWVVWRRGQV